MALMGRLKSAELSFTPSTLQLIPFHLCSRLRTWEELKGALNFRIKKNFLSSLKNYSSPISKEYSSRRRAMGNLNDSS